MRRYRLGDWLFFGPLPGPYASDDYTIVVRVARGWGVIWRYASPAAWLAQACMGRLSLAMGPPLEWPTVARDARGWRIAVAAWSVRWDV